MVVKHFLLHHQMHDIANAGVIEDGSNCLGLDTNKMYMI